LKLDGFFFNLKAYNTDWFLVVLGYGDSSGICRFGLKIIDIGLTSFFLFNFFGETMYAYEGSRFIGQSVTQLAASELTIMGRTIVVEHWRYNIPYVS